ncbi:MAG: hypothetical protein JWQ09_2767 [Segetibacter sp.]|nr:hypothetical protein [Segetibacter sp.]
MEWSLNSIGKITGMFRGFYFIVLIISQLLFTIGCNSEKHKGELQFYYYPDKNVYYDPVKKDFWYSLNGTKSWSKFTNANNVEPATLGEKVVIYSSKADVYRDNENHRKLYAGRLYSISTGDTGIASIGPEVGERKVVQKRRPIATKKRVSNKPKNSIGKFFDKILGKSK